MGPTAREEAHVSIIRTPEPSEAWSHDLELSSLAELAAAADAAFAGRAGLPGPGGPA